MRQAVMLPESVMDEPDELRAWIRRGLAYGETLPPKRTKAPAKAKATAKAKPVRKKPR